jgi:uncharacterized protein YvpB
MTKKLFKTIPVSLIISLFVLPFFFLIPPVKAAVGDGCCEMTKIVNEKVKQFITTNADGCKSDDYYTALFHPNQVVSGQSCIDKAVDNLGTSLPKFSNPLANPKLAVSIPGLLNFRPISCTANPEDPASQICIVPWLADYIKGLYTYGIGILIILAVIVMMVGGVVWLTAAGDAKKITDAKSWIGGSLLGVLIAVSSFMILNIINPALTTLSPIKLISPGKKDLEIQQLDPEDLTPQFTTDIPEGSHGTGSGDYKLPIIYQGSYPGCIPSSGCGPTSLTMILNYYSINKGVEEVANDAKNASCWSCSGWQGGMPCFQTLLKKYDSNFKTKGGSSFDDIKELLKYGPVIASIKNTGCKERGSSCRCPFTGGGHYVVFTGYSNGTFYTNDPNAGNKGKTGEISEASFIKNCTINAGVMAIYK